MEVLSTGADIKALANFLWGISAEGSAAQHLKQKFTSACAEVPVSPNI